MKIKFKWVILLLFLSQYAFSQEIDLSKCDMPGILFGLFGGLPVDTIYHSNTNVLKQLDTISKRKLLIINEKEQNMFLVIDSSSKFFSITQQTDSLIYGYNIDLYNSEITITITKDKDCFFEYVILNTKGEVLVLGICDYNLPNSCFSIQYKNSIPFIKTEYMPNKFIKGKDLDKLIINYKAQKTIPVKESYYDEKGKIQNTIDYDINMFFKK